MLLKAVHLIDRKDHRLPAPSQHICHLGIRIHQPLAHIHQENDHIRRVDGNLRLLSHLGENNILALRLNTSRIYYSEMMVQPLYLRIDPVPGNAGVSFTIEIFPPARALNNVDFPTLGRPTIATIGLLIDLSPSVCCLFLLSQN